VVQCPVPGAPYRLPNPSASFVLWLVLVSVLLDNMLMTNAILMPLEIDFIIGYRPHNWLHLVVAGLEPVLATFENGHLIWELKPSLIVYERM
jgi:hypothetical protein